MNLKPGMESERRNRVNEREREIRGERVKYELKSVMKKRAKS